MARSNGYESDIICSNCGYHFDELKQDVPICPMIVGKIKESLFDPCNCPSCGKKIKDVHFIFERRIYLVVVEE